MGKKRYEKGGYYRPVEEKVIRRQERAQSDGCPICGGRFSWSRPRAGAALVKRCRMCGYTSRA